LITQFSSLLNPHAEYLSDIMDENANEFFDERSTPIPPMNAAILERNRDRILNIFSSDAIRIYDKDDSWGEIVDGLFSDLDVDKEWIRVFAIQSAYGTVSPDRKRQSPDIVEDDVSSVDSLPVSRPTKQPVRKSAAVSSAISETLPPVVNPIKKPFIPTESIPTIGDSAGYDFPNLNPNAPRTLRQITVTLAQSICRRINIMKCSCDYEEGLIAKCVCESEEGKYLVAANIVRSRQVKLVSQSGDSRLLKESEYFVSWRPYKNGVKYPNAWVSVDVFQQWRSGVLLDYLVNRIQYA